MATLEKPKTKKIKISATNKDSNQQCAIKEDKVETTEKPLINNTKKTVEKKLQDFVKPELVDLNNIITNDCAILSTKESNILNDMDMDKDNDNDNEEPSRIKNEDGIAPSKTMAQTNVLNDHAPTAPPSNPNALSSVCIQYPNLLPIQKQQEECPSEVVYTTPNIRTPNWRLALTQLDLFSEKELRQFYCCCELEEVEQFEMEFLMNSLLDSYESDPLFISLREYYNLQGKLTINVHDMKKFRQEANMTENQIWKTDTITKTFASKCGCGKELKDTVDYSIMKIDENKRLDFAKALKDLYDTLTGTYITNSIIAKIEKVKIDQIINDIISLPLYNDDNNNNKNQKYLKLQQHLNENEIKCMMQMRKALTILFLFARKLSPNKIFTEHLQIWLEKSISFYVKVATKEDHWFLIFNILRCPSGVGNWASQLLQIPCAKDCKKQMVQHANDMPLPFNSPEIRLCMTLLKVLLMPIAKRNEYLEEFFKSQQVLTDPAKEERWTIIDSDGEDEHTSNGECVGLKENDLIALLNQIPFEELFRSALVIEKFLDDYIIQVDLITGHKILQVLSFFHQLIDLLGQGLTTYNTERYKQLAKRLGRLMRHCLQYFSAYLELFRNNHISKEKQLLERLALEYNVFLMKGCAHIYRARNLSTWQYFSLLPYSDMDLDTIWQIFYYLNVGFPEIISKPQEDYMDLLTSPDIWLKFNAANSDSSPEDLYYLLQAFFEMANDRDRVTDWNLIKTIFLHIFHIGFVNRETRDVCYKTARDMLVNLALCYESLMSCLLVHLKVAVANTENIHYLFKALPLENWKPDMASFEILSNWLLHFDFKSSENLLSRLIISHLNWGFDLDQRLFLPHNIHIRMACLISEALNKHAPEIIGVSGISESVRQITNIMDYCSPITTQQFSCWCWSIVSLLRLHLMDQNIDTVKKVLQNPAESLMFTLELERIELIYQGVLENHPLAVYVGILVSLHGHSIPLICQKGFELMLKLLNDHRHAAVIRCLELIVPLFLEIPDTLANAEGFHNVLTCLLNADRTYLKVAKDMIYSNHIGPVLELLDNMIHHQITSYQRYGLNTPLNLINIWLLCLTSLPNWQTTYVVYLLDKILAIAIQFPDGYHQTIVYFTNYFKDCNEWKGVSLGKGLKGFFTSTPNSKIPTISSQYPWLALILLEIEFSYNDTEIWNEFLCELRQARTNANLDGILKKTCSMHKIPPYTADKLCIYKYANLLATLHVHHPLFPILGQKFFQLYMARVPVLQDDNSFRQIHGVSDKFYDFNITLMKSVKTNLKAAEILYTDEATKNTKNDTLAYYYRNCSKLMKTFLVWLEDTSINQLSKDCTDIPPQYNCEKLKDIFYGNAEMWTEYLYLPSVRAEQRYQAEQWMRKCYRLNQMKPLRTPIVSKAKTLPFDCIKALLRSYEKRLPLPQHAIPSKCKETITITKESFQELKENLNVLKRTAENFTLKFAELNTVQRNYYDRLSSLYKMLYYEEVFYKNCSQKVCARPANITRKMEKIHLDEFVQQQINNYRDQHEVLVDEILNAKVNEFALSCQQIEKIIRLLVNPVDQSMYNAAIGIKSFYYIIENIDDVTTNFEATNQIFTDLLSNLGICIQRNQEEECLNVLTLTLKRPDVIKQLSAVFEPSHTGPNYFTESYKFLIDSYLKQCDIDILFVLFSKFDLVTWLEKYQPKLSCIKALLLLILQGLEYWSQPLPKIKTVNLLQDLFRRHLVHIFQYDFPEHYGEVMALILQRSSDQKLMPEVLYDILNAILINCGCEQMPWEASPVKMHEVAVKFSTHQKLFTLKAACDTAIMLGRHFQKERLEYGLHGLYPKHKKYCHVLSMWFHCVGYCIVVKAICTYKDLLADQISDIIFGSIIDMYAPWLIIYTRQTVTECTSNWVRELADSGHGKMLFPWSKQYIPSCQLMLKPFVSTLKYTLENLPISQQILGHSFAWYIHHFAVPHVESCVYDPLHENFADLPWEIFKPNTDHIDLLYESVNKFIPKSHAMLGHIFIRVNWEKWFAEVLPTIQKTYLTKAISRLFTIFVKIAFEPNIHVHINTSKIMEEAIKYQWNLVDCTELESLLKWFVCTIEPTLVLSIPKDTNYVDRAVLELLALSCAMRPKLLSDIAQSSEKRLLYVKSMIRLHRACIRKNPRLLSNKDGRCAYAKAFNDLLHSIKDTFSCIEDLNQQHFEAYNIMLEILLPMQTENEDVSNVHLDCLKNYATEIAAPGDVLVCSILKAVNSMKVYIRGIYELLEKTMYFYFRSSESSLTWHTPSWLKLLDILKITLDKVELMPILSCNCHFILHGFILYKMAKLSSNRDRITFLQDLTQLIANLKTEPETEPELAIIWGCLIVWGCEIYLAEPQNVKKPLYMLAQHLQLISNEADSWSDGLLNVIGLKKNIITNERRVLTRCLAIVIYSIFPSNRAKSMANDEYCSAMRELSMLLTNKKFFDIKPLIVEVIGILNEQPVPQLKAIPQLIYRLINSFYRGNGYLITLPEIWQLNYKFT